MADFQWEADIKRIYGTKDNYLTADEIISLQKKLGWISESKLSIYVQKWDEIRKILSDSPTPEQVLEMLTSVGLHCADFERMYSDTKIQNAKKYAKYLKDRYTVLWLYEQVR